MKKLANGVLVPRFLFAEYFRALGIDLKSIAQVHLYGGRERAAIVEGSEFRKFADRLKFSFTRETSGKARFHWPGHGFRSNDSIDLITNVAIYVKKKPPVWNQREYGFEDEDGDEIEGIPYTQTEMRGGTRVYVNDRLAGSIKRNLLSGELAVPGSEAQGELRYSLKKALKTFSVDLRSARTLELIDDDRSVAQLRVDEISGEPEFAPVPDSHGQVALHLKQNGKNVQYNCSALFLQTGRRVLALQ
jgi:hypothetical protein